MLLLAGCADFKFGDLVSGTPDTADAPEQAKVEDMQGLATLLDKRSRETPAPSQTVPRIEPAALVGAKVAQITSWMGPPSLVWREGGNAMWRYHDRECVILLFVDGNDIVRDARLSRRDGAGLTGCGNAIGQRIVTRPVG